MCGLCGAYGFGLVRVWSGMWSGQRCLLWSGVAWGVWLLACAGRGLGWGAVSGVWGVEAVRALGCGLGWGMGSVWGVWGVWDVWCGVRGVGVRGGLVWALCGLVGCGAWGLVEGFSRLLFSSPSPGCLAARSGAERQ